MTLIFSTENRILLNKKNADKLLNLNYSNQFIPLLNFNKKTQAKEDKTLFSLSSLYLDKSFFVKAVRDNRFMNQHSKHLSTQFIDCYLFFQPFLTSTLLRGTNTFKRSKAYPTQILNLPVSLNLSSTNLLTSTCVARKASSIYKSSYKSSYNYKSTICKKLCPIQIGDLQGARANQRFCAPSNRRFDKEQHLLTNRRFVLARTCTCTYLYGAKLSFEKNVQHQLIRRLTKTREQKLKLRILNTSKVKKKCTHSLQPQFTLEKNTSLRSNQKKAQQNKKHLKNRITESLILQCSQLIPTTRYTKAELLLGFTKVNKIKLFVPKMKKWGFAFSSSFLLIAMLSILQKQEQSNWRFPFLRRQLAGYFIFNQESSWECFKNITSQYLNRKVSDQALVFQTRPASYDYLLKKERQENRDNTIPNKGLYTQSTRYTTRDHDQGLIDLQSCSLKTNTTVPITEWQNNLSARFGKWTTQVEKIASYKDQLYIDFTKPWNQQFIQDFTAVFPTRTLDEARKVKTVWMVKPLYQMDARRVPNEIEVWKKRKDFVSRRKIKAKHKLCDFKERVFRENDDIPSKMSSSFARTCKENRVFRKKIENQKLDRFKKVLLSKSHSQNDKETKTKSIKLSSYVQRNDVLKNFFYELGLFSIPNQAYLHERANGLQEQEKPIFKDFRSLKNNQDASLYQDFSQKQADLEKSVDLHEKSQNPIERLLSYFKRDQSKKEVDNDFEIDLLQNQDKKEIAHFPYKYVPIYDNMLLPSNSKMMPYFAQRTTQRKEICKGNAKPETGTLTKFVMQSTDNIDLEKLSCFSPLSFLLSEEKTSSISENLRDLENRQAKDESGTYSLIQSEISEGQPDNLLVLRVMHTIPNRRSQVRSTFRFSDLHVRAFNRSFVKSWKKSEVTKSGRRTSDYNQRNQKIKEGGSLSLQNKDLDGMETISSSVFSKRNSLCNRFMSGYRILSAKKQEAYKNQFCFTLLSFSPYTSEICKGLKALCPIQIGYLQGARANKRFSAPSNRRFDKEQHHLTNFLTGTNQRFVRSVIKVPPALPFYEKFVQLDNDKEYQSKVLLLNHKNGTMRAFKKMPYRELALPLQKSFSHNKLKSSYKYKSKICKKLSTCNPLSLRIGLKKGTENRFKEIEPIFEQINKTIQISPHRLAFKEPLFTDYNDYLNWPKDDPAAISISPSLEEDRAIDESWNEHIKKESPLSQVNAFDDKPERKGKNREKSKSFKDKEDQSLVNEYVIQNSGDSQFQFGENVTPLNSNKENQDKDAVLREPGFLSQRRLDNEKSLDSSDFDSGLQSPAFLEEDKKKEITKWEWLHNVRESEMEVEKRKECQKLDYPDKKVLLTNSLQPKSGLAREKDSAKLRFASELTFKNRKAFLVSDRKSSFFGITNLFPKRLIAEDQKVINNQILKDTYDRRSLGVINPIEQQTANRKQGQAVTFTELTGLKVLQNKSQEKSYTTVWQHPVLTPNRRLRLRVADALKALQNNNAQSRIDSLILCQSHRWWQKRRTSSSLLGSPSKRYMVIPEITKDDWKSIVEWQLKLYFLEEEKRLEPLILEKIQLSKPLQDQASSKLKSNISSQAVLKDSNKKVPDSNNLGLTSKRIDSKSLAHDLKIKRIAVYLPWLTIKKSLKKPFEWPLTRLAFTNSDDKSGQRLLKLHFRGFHSHKQIEDLFGFANLKNRSLYKSKSELSTYTSKQERLFREGQEKVRYASNKDKVSPLIEVSSCKKNFINAKKPCSCFVSFISGTRSDELKNATTKQGKLATYKPFVFEIVAKDRPFISLVALIQQLLLAIAIKQIFQRTYQLFRNRILNQVKNSSLGIALLRFAPLLFNNQSRTNQIALFKHLKKRLKDTAGSEDTVSSLSEIVWYLRNACRGRMVPRGVVLVEKDIADEQMKDDAHTSTNQRFVRRFVRARHVHPAQSFGLQQTESLTRKKANSNFRFNRLRARQSTEFLKAIGGEAQVPVIVQSLRALPYTQSHPQQRLEKIIDLAKKRAPCILFLDDLDAIGQSRSLLINRNDLDLTSSVGKNKSNQSKVLTGQNKNKLCLQGQERANKSQNLLINRNSSSVSNDKLKWKSYNTDFSSSFSLFNRNGIAFDRQSISDLSSFAKSSQNLASHPLLLSHFFLSNRASANTLSTRSFLLCVAGRTKKKNTSSQKFVSKAKQANIESEKLTKFAGKKSMTALPNIVPTCYYKTQLDITNIKSDLDPKNKETEKVIEQRRLDLMLRLLTVMDGISHLKGVLIVTTSKDPSSLDPALLRPGRFERFIDLKLPNKKRRIDLLKVNTSKIGSINPMPWQYLGAQTENMTGTDIADAINHSAFKAIIESTPHTLSTLEYGLSRVHGFSRNNFASISWFSLKSRLRDLEQLRETSTSTSTNQRFVRFFVRRFVRLFSGLKLKGLPFALAKAANKSSILCSVGGNKRHHFESETLFTNQNNRKSRGKSLAQDLKTQAYFSKAGKSVARELIFARGFGPSNSIATRFNSVKLRKSLKKKQKSNNSKNIENYNFRIVNFARDVSILHSGRASKSLFLDSTNKLCSASNQKRTSYGYNSPTRNLLFLLFNARVNSSKTKFCNSKLCAYRSLLLVKPSVYCKAPLCTRSIKLKSCKLICCKTKNLTSTSTNQRVVRRFVKRFVRSFVLVLRSKHKSKICVAPFVQNTKFRLLHTRFFVKKTPKNRIDKHRICKSLEKMSETLKIFKRPTGNWYRLYLPKIEINKNNREWLSPDRFSNQHISLFDLNHANQKLLFEQKSSCKQLCKKICKQRLASSPNKTAKADLNSLNFLSFDRAKVKEEQNRSLAKLDSFQSLPKTFNAESHVTTDYTITLNCFYAAFQNLSENRELLDLLVDHLIRFKFARSHEIVRISRFYLYDNCY